MSKSKRQASLREVYCDSYEPNVVNIKKALSPIKPLTKSQEAYMTKLQNYDLNFCYGAAGSGKTYVTAALAAEALSNHRIAKIIVTRPAIEADGEDMGFLPGELEEKFAPWFEPFRDALEERLGTGAVDYHLKRGSIIPSPLAYMRGKSFKDSWVIMDEAQNSTPGQMKMFLTRMGEGCRMSILGDVKQTDLKTRNGMEDAIEVLKDMPEAGFHEFNIEDCVRHGIVKKILERYER